MPASRRARAMTLAPRSWPSRPGFATSTRIFCSAGILTVRSERSRIQQGQGIQPIGGSDAVDLVGFSSYIVFISKLRHRYQQATLRYGSHGFAIFSICTGLGIL